MRDNEGCLHRATRFMWRGLLILSNCGSVIDTTEEDDHE